MKRLLLLLASICLLCFASTSLHAQPNFDLVGFATENGGTTGGQSGTTVTATSYAELKAYAESTTPYIIMVQGTISNGANGGKIDIQSNKSIIGVGNNAFLNGIGLEIKNHNNVIIQNLRITLIGVTTRIDTPGVYSSTGDNGQPQILVNGGDCVSISGTSTNIWIDHCEIFSEDPSVQTNKDLYDGLIDIKGTTGFITISWCYIHDHHKGGLVGASDTDLWADRKVTLHHNYYNKVLLRVPMYRGSTGHFFNNYIVGATDATEIRANTCVRVEKNYYETLHYSIYTPSESPGSTERIDNIIISQASRPFPNDCVADIPYSYASVLTSNTADVKTLVPQWSGVGKMGNDCNGDYLGSAYMDDCDTCVGGNTGLTACVMDCNGKENGTATVDGCGVCSGGDTGVTPCDDSCSWAEYQAEDGIISSGTIDSNHVGYTGTGFVNTANAIGEWCEYVINVTTAGTYNLRFRYGNGGIVDRSQSVAVNGSTQINNLGFPNTGAWTTWLNTNFTLNLSQGNNTIRFTSLTDSGAANLDRLDICSGEALSVIQASSESNFSLYPNPTHTQVTLELKEDIAKNAFIQLYDSTGRLIINQPLKDSKQSLNLQGLSSGVYLIKVSNFNKHIVKRIIKL
ncbi:T9SS type A sorting domain-containing protein [Mariniflexile soesokkakense]|uniref:T9SS type A sorting domain-containing protein n=1 Tax=Mariniflexile soesokkakense TaxID=1343160 RepID=A0ABV0A6K5_9FLAO